MFQLIPSFTREMSQYVSDGTENRHLNIVTKANQTEKLKLLEPIDTDKSKAYPLKTNLCILSAGLLIILYLIIYLL